MASNFGDLELKQKLSILATAKERDKLEVYIEGIPDFLKLFSNPIVESIYLGEL
jgi:hypothetical protein